MASPRATSPRGSGGLALPGSLARKWPLLSSPPLSSALPPHLLLQQTLLPSGPSSASPTRQAFSIASLLLPASRDSISHSFSPPVARVLFFCFDVQVSSLLSWRQLLDHSLLLPACRSTFLSVKIIPLQLLNASLSLPLAPQARHCALRPPSRIKSPRHRGTKPNSYNIVIMFVDPARSWRWTIADPQPVNNQSPP